MDTPTPTPIERAVDLAGGAVKLGDSVGVSFQAVYKWIKKGYPPTERCESIEAAVGGKVTRFELLPPGFGSKLSRRSTDAESTVRRGDEGTQGHENVNPAEIETSATFSR